MRRQSVYLALIGFMLLLGISVFTYFLILTRRTSDQIKEIKGVKHSEEKSQIPQLSQRHSPKMEQAAGQKQGETQEPLDLASQSDQSTDASPEEQETTSSYLPSSGLDEDETTLRIKELEDQLANNRQQFRELNKQRRELAQEIFAYSWDNMIEKNKAIEKQMMAHEIPQDEARKLMRQNIADHGSKLKQLTEMDQELLKPLSDNDKQFAAIRAELKHLNSLREQQDQ